MRFIGNKENLLGHIHATFERYDIRGERFFDFFAGTANVGRFFKAQNYCVRSNDMLYMSYCLQKAYIENNSEPAFDKLLPAIGLKTHAGITPLHAVVDYLNGIDDVCGFIASNYTPLGTKDLPQPRMYFSEENGMRIDAIRSKIEEWHRRELLCENEYYILIACLIESVSFYANVAGVYAAFYKKWDPRAVKRLTLRPIAICCNGRDNRAHNTDSMLLVPEIDTDILYLDPPYNARQYLPNYHLLETIARYDNPSIHGVTGMRNYSMQKSTFCNPRTALRDLEIIAANAHYRHLVLSYNSEGIMPTDCILSLLSGYGRVRLIETDYTRFKSNNKGLSRTKRNVREQLFIISR